VGVVKEWMQLGKWLRFNGFGERVMWDFLSIYGLSRLWIDMETMILMNQENHGERVE